MALGWAWLAGVEGLAWGWGPDGHRAIGELAWQRLPTEVQSAIGPNAERFVESCLAADVRRAELPSEGPRHYFNVERLVPRRMWGGWPLPPGDIEDLYRQAPRSMAAFSRFRRGRVSVRALGTLPYAIVETAERLGRALQNGAVTDARVAAGDLCHYVGDLVQPLHNTVNHRGEASGNRQCWAFSLRSVHERYESAFVALYAQTLKAGAAAQMTARTVIAPGPGSRPTEDATSKDGAIIERLLAQSQRAYGRLSRILASDRSAFATTSACRPAASRRAFARMFAEVGAMTMRQFAEAAQLLADLLLAATRARGRN